MKKTLSVLLSLMFVLGALYGQKESAYKDLKLIRHYDLSKYPLRLGDIEYRLDGKKVDKQTYDDYARLSGSLDSCKPCLLQYYKGKQLDKEVVSYRDVPVGLYMTYHSNGVIREQGQYKENKGLDWNTFLETAAGTKEGEWFYYDEKGQLLYSEFWENGDFVKQVPEQAKAEIAKVILTRDGKEVTDSIILYNDLLNVRFGIQPIYKNSSRKGLDLKAKIAVSSLYKTYSFQYVIDTISSFNLNDLLTEKDFKYYDSPLLLNVWNKDELIDRFRLYMPRRTPVYRDYNIDTTNIKADSSARELINYDFYLVNLNHPSRQIKLKSYYDIEYYSDLINDTLKISQRNTLSGYIYGLNEQAFDFKAYYEENDIEFLDYSRLISQKSYTDNDCSEYYVRRTLKFDQMPILIYSSPRRKMINKISKLVAMASAVTSLVVAPLASLNYKTGTFNKDRYFTIAGAGLIGASISVPFYLFTKKPKTYYLDVFWALEKRKKT